MPRRRRTDEAQTSAEATPTVETEVLGPEQRGPIRETVASDMDIEESISGADKIVRDVMVRQLVQNPRETQENILLNQDDPVLRILDKVVQGIKHGTDISPHQEEISKLILNQDSRAELIDQILLTHDYDRLLKYVKARKSIEDFLLQCASRGDLSATEALAFMKIIQSEAGGLQDRIKSGAVGVKDVLQLVGKADYALRNREDEIAKKFKKTSPQGREIVRRFAHKLNKISAERKKNEKS